MLGVDEVEGASGSTHGRREGHASVMPKLTGMAKWGVSATGARDGRGGRKFGKDVVVGVAKTMVPSGGRNNGGKGVGCGNMGGGRWDEEANGI